MVETTEAVETNEWTLMFYFASDNPLAPSIVSQLKALKAAGFQARANVIAHFDPYTRDTPSHVFEVNGVEKRAGKLREPPVESSVGFDNDDPFVRNLVLDKIWGEDDKDGETVRGLIRSALNKRRNGSGRRARKGGAGDPKLPVLPKGSFNGEQSPEESLTKFLDFCRTEYPARRYMLFLLGHGVVVSNDIFLFDANPGGQSEAGGGGGNGGGNGGGAGGDDGDAGKNKARPRNSLALKDLAHVLREFKDKIGDSQFELIGFHSCSMSGVEVAYELQGTANYMLASQGPAFVGSWPYRQILLRVFNDLGDGKPPLDAAAIKEMLIKVFYYVVYNSYDFQLAGYPFDLSLCDLNRVGELTRPLDDLATALKAGLAGGPDLSDDAVPLARELILLSHWDAQSFWQENYTDLYDFCLRLRRRCRHVYPELRESDATRLAILDACEAVIAVLEKGAPGDDDRFIVRAEFVGAEYQYSHGLSIFFPWSRPAGRFFKTYLSYKFSEQTSWAKFLDEYFEQTLRETREEEDAKLGHRSERTPNVEGEVFELLQVIGTRVFNNLGELAKGGADDRLDGPLPGKGGADDRTGGECDCPTFKNHPTFTGVGRRQRRNEKGLKQPVSQSIGERFTIF